MSTGSVNLGESTYQRADVIRNSVGKETEGPGMVGTRHNSFLLGQLGQIATAKGGVQTAEWRACRQGECARWSGRFSASLSNARLPYSYSCSAPGFVPLGSRRREKPQVEGGG